MTTQRIIDVIKEEVAAEKIYMIQRSWESTKNMLDTPAYNPDWFAAQCEVLYDMAVRLDGATDEQDEEVKALRREIVRTCEDKTGHDLRA